MQAMEHRPQRGQTLARCAKSVEESAAPEHLHTTGWLLAASIPGLSASAIIIMIMIITVVVSITTIILIYS